MVAAVKYPPLGGRGASGGLPHLQYRSFPAAEANAALNAATMVIVQFESAQAVDKAEEIVGVEGVDMVLIGTNDLLADMGLDGQFEHAKVREAYARTIAACRKHGKHVGVGGLASQAEARGRVRQDGRALRLDRHGPWPSCWPRPPAARQAGARYRRLTRDKTRCRRKVMVGRLAALALASWWRWRAPRRPRSRRCGSPSSSASAICR